MNTLILVFALLCAASAVPQFAPYNKLDLKFAGPGAPAAPISLRPIGNAVQPPRRVTPSGGEIQVKHGDHIHKIGLTEEIVYTGDGRGSGGDGRGPGGDGRGSGGDGRGRGGDGRGSGGGGRGPGGDGRVTTPVVRGPVITPGVRGTPSGTGLGANLNPSFRIAEQPNNGQYDAILKQEHALDYDGTYRYNFDAENGISLEEHGGLQNIGQENEAMAAQGFYSYTGPDGVIYTVTYIADENGFQPTGVHIPR